MSHEISKTPGVIKTCIYTLLTLGRHREWFISRPAVGVSAVLSTQYGVSLILNANIIETCNRWHCPVSWRTCPFLQSTKQLYYGQYDNTFEKECATKICILPKCWEMASQWALQLCNDHDAALLGQSPLQNPSESTHPNIRNDNNSRCQCQWTIYIAPIVEGQIWGAGVWVTRGDKQKQKGEI